MAPSVRNNRMLGAICCLGNDLPFSYLVSYTLNAALAQIGRSTSMVRVTRRFNSARRLKFLLDNLKIALYTNYNLIFLMIL